MGLAAELIAALDAALERAGEDIVLRRIVGTSNQANVDVPCRAFVRTPGADELVGGVAQDDQLVILSPTPIARAQWPGGELPSAVVADPSLPRDGDRVIVKGRTHAVGHVRPILIAGALVRIELAARG